jgi:TonB family protein
MAQPLRSDDFTAPQNLQFTHFGILNAGSQSKSSLATAITVNLIAAALLIAIGAETKKVVDERRRVAMLVAPVEIKEPEPVPPPKVVLPKITPPPVVKVEPPKIQLPEAKLPEPPLVPVVHMNQPVPINQPAPPKLVKAPPAPVVVNLARAEAASVVNNNPRPAPVALGRNDNPIAPSDRPATAAVNLGQRGAPGMPSTSSSAGNRAAAVSLGSGSPASQEMAGNGSRAVQGVALGRTGGTGPMNSTGRNGVTAGQVNLGMIQQAAMPHPPALAAVTTRSAPKVIYKPRPDYTPEARALHLEGTISVRLRVAASGAVTVIGVGNGLGHGLDESARRAVQSTRFQPAVDASGNPVEWEGVVNVVFQMAE